MDNYSSNLVGLVKSADMEKQSKRWLRRLLEMTDKKLTKHKPSSDDLAFFAQDAVRPANSRFWDSDGALIPIFKGTAKERLAKFTSRGVRPRVRKINPDYYDRRDLYNELKNYMREALEKNNANNPILKKHSQLKDTISRVENMARSNLVLASYGKHQPTPHVLKEYYTPVPYGITPHLADISKSTEANKLARDAYKNGLTSVTVEPQPTYKGGTMNEVLVGGPGIPYEPKDVAMMREAVAKSDLNDAQHQLYETITEDLTGKNRFRLKSMYVEDTPTNRAYFGISSETPNISIESLVPSTRDVVFKGDFKHISHDSKILDAIPDKFVKSKEALRNILQNVRLGHHKSNARWYSPNPAVASGYAHMLGKNLIKIDPRVYRKKLTEIPANNQHNLTRAERLLSHLDTLNDELRTFDNYFATRPVWLR